MNLTQEALRVMQKIGQINQDLSVGDILFDCFQKEATENGQSLNFLRKISVEDIYTKVEKTLAYMAKDDSHLTDEEFSEWTNKK